MTWKAATETQKVFEARETTTGEVKRTGTRGDLVFGSNSQLRALAKVNAADDVKALFVDQIVKAWVKVMELDRLDLAA
ncbi:hypothetical protein [uncultured Sulfitobacter sp.]|uniref:hypothetical protein n=1 Tax=uncultured Sulfitobacter sp. TaxID=191468 RepID=UPI0026317A3B|nr:hypothetical protein [uncultured Sulfitobacter sp.]